MIRLGYGPQTMVDANRREVLAPWTREEWLAYLDGWAKARDACPIPPERRGKHEQHCGFGATEAKRTAQS